MQAITRSEVLKTVRLFNILSPTGEETTVCIGAAPDYECKQNPRFYIMKATDDIGARVWDGYSIYYKDAPELGPRQIYIKIDKSPPPGTEETYIRDEENLEAMIEQKIIKAVEIMHEDEKRVYVAVELLLTDREIIHRCEGCADWEDVVSTTSKFKRCLGCSKYQYYYYCGNKCQKENWSGQAGQIAHKLVCKKDEATAKKMIQSEIEKFNKEMGYKPEDESSRETNVLEN